MDGELQHAGLAVVIRLACEKCAKQFRLHSSKQVDTADGKRWLVNIAAVLGQLATGGGTSALSRMLSCMGIPDMPKSMFTATERSLEKNMAQLLELNIAEAGEEERKLAIQRKDYHQGVPAITVIADGGWSKRSHRHSYNARSGVAVIFGKETKKLLYLAVRNKYCSICSIAENRGQQPQQHACYRNWAGSSGAMESDIISEGFKQSEKAHGVRYMRLIGDGDSSVMSTIRQFVPYGPFVQKILCANHACKCYRTHLEKLRSDHPEFCKRGALTKRAIQRLVVGARVAIRMHSQTGNIAQLRHDLRNGPDHVFGIHEKCNPHFCTTAATHQHAQSPTTSGSQQPSISPAPSPSASQQPSTSPAPSTSASQSSTPHAPSTSGSQHPPTSPIELCSSDSTTIHFGDLSPLLDPISVETYPPHSTEDELDACSAPPEVTTPTTTLPAGLVENVKSCGDQLVSMSAQLITMQPNQQSC